MPRRAMPIILLSLLGCTTRVALADDVPSPKPNDARPVRVVVWDEQQPQQKPAYDNFLGNAIVDHLKSLPGFTVRSVKLDDPGQGVIRLPVSSDTSLLRTWPHHTRTAACGSGSLTNRLGRHSAPSPGTPREGWGGGLNRQQDTERG